MRADRLLSILMLLQARGRQTARQLAGELEVSERTIYRDMVALSTAGVPVYSDSGPGGGFSLIESYRTTLTGLSRDEVRALFMLSVPHAFTDLGMTQELKGALFKLAASLPDSLREDEAFVRSRFYLDANWWEEEAAASPHLRRIQAAVWADEMMRITYNPIGTVQISLEAAPYALVAKAGSWYLVYFYAGIFRVLGVSELLEVQPVGGKFERKANFDLPRFWKSCCEERKEVRRQYEVRVRAARAILPALPVIPTGSAQPTCMDEEPVELTLAFESLIDARSRLLAFGRAVEVLSPESLRRSMQDVAAQIVRVYR